MNAESGLSAAFQTPHQVSTTTVTDEPHTSAPDSLFYVVRDRLEPDPRYASGPRDARVDDWWTSTALQAVRELAKTGAPFQVFDAVTRFGLPEPTSSAQWGALMRRAAGEGIVEMIGAEPSRRPTCNGALTRVWRGRST